MLKRILAGITVFVLAAVLTISFFPFTREGVRAAEDNPVEKGQVANVKGEFSGRKFGRGQRFMMRKFQDLDGDGLPDLPEGFTCPRDKDGDGVPDLPNGVTPLWKRDRLADPEGDGEAFGMGRRRMMREARGLGGEGYPDLPEGFTRPCDRDGDGVPDLSDGAGPRRNRDRLIDPEDTAACPFRGRGRQGAAASETP